jgi:hypothetical protein
MKVEVLKARAAESNSWIPKYIVVYGAYKVKVRAQSQGTCEAEECVFLTNHRLRSTQVDVP